MRLVTRASSSRAVVRDEPGWTHSSSLPHDTRQKDEQKQNYFYDSEHICATIRGNCTPTQGSHYIASYKCWLHIYLQGFFLKLVSIYHKPSTTPKDFPCLMLHLTAIVSYKCLLSIYITSGILPNLEIGNWISTSNTESPQRIFPA